MKAGDQFLAYLLLRLTIGVNFIMHAVPRFFAGVGTFRDKMVRDFDATPLPSTFVYLFGSVLTYVELVIGLLLTVGFLTRSSSFAGGLLMITLIFGTAFQQKWDTVGTQMIYSLFFFLLIWFRHANYYSVDRMILGRD